MAGIGFFAPLPIALMIPFMAYQSLAMGEAFGLGFQHGKRRISAMSNENFNKMSFIQMQDKLNADISAGIPSMTRQMDKFATLQTTVIKELIDYIKLLGPAIKESIHEGGADFSDLLTILLQGGGKVLTDTAGGLAGSILPPASAYRGGDPRLDAVINSQQYKNANLGTKKKLISPLLFMLGYTQKQINEFIGAVKPSGYKPPVFDKDTRLQEELDNIPKTPPPTVPPVSSKRRAGQSQKLEMRRLNLIIQKAQRDFGRQKDQGQRKIIRKLIADTYQLIQNLKARYIF